MVNGRRVTSIDVVLVVWKVVEALTGETEGSSVVVVVLLVPLQTVRTVDCGAV